MEARDVLLTLTLLMKGARASGETGWAGLSSEGRRAWAAWLGGQVVRAPPLRVCLSQAISPADYKALDAVCRAMPGL